MTVFVLIFLVLVAALSGCSSSSGNVDVARADITISSVSSDSASLPNLAGIAFADVAGQRGINFQWPQQPKPMRALEAIGCGCAFLDFDGDRWLDVLLVADPHARLYRNVDGERFEDVTDISGLSTAEGNWIGCAVGDVDGDGWLDVLLTGFHRLALFHNELGQTFQEITVSAGLDPANHEQWATGAGFMDLDGDGYLDLVILNYVVFGPESQQYCEVTKGVVSGCRPAVYDPEFAEVWRNDSGRKFEFVPASESGMDTTHGVDLVLAFVDYDDDHRPDFYIGNDGTPAELMRNLGGMKFENAGLISGLSVGREHRPMASMGADWGDFNRDGRFDLAVTDFQKSGFALYRNEGTGFFLEVGNPTGVSLVTRERLGFGAKWFDMDNDGWSDICFVNGHVYDNAGQVDPTGAEFRQPIMLFRNLEGARFVDLVPSLDEHIARPIVGRGSAAGDFNRDGRTDMLIVDYEGPVMLLENQSRSDHHWITLELRGAAPNEFAHGAKVVGHAGATTFVGQVAPASSYLSSSSPEIHWGLGDYKQLDRLTIQWPSGREQSLANVPVDRFVQIVEEAPTR